MNPELLALLKKTLDEKQFAYKQIADGVEQGSKMLVLLENDVRVIRAELERLESLN